MKLSLTATLFILLHVSSSFSAPVSQSKPSASPNANRFRRRALSSGHALSSSTNSTASDIAVRSLGSATYITATPNNSTSGLGSVAARAPQSYLSPDRAGCTPANKKFLKEALKSTVRLTEAAIHALSLPRMEERWLVKRLLGFPTKRGLAELISCYEDIADVLSGRFSEIVGRYYHMHSLQFSCLPTDPENPQMRARIQNTPDTSTIFLYPPFFDLPSDPSASRELELLDESISKIFNGDPPDPNFRPKYAAFELLYMIQQASVVVGGGRVTYEYSDGAPGFVMALPLNKRFLDIGARTLIIPVAGLASSWF